MSRRLPSRPTSLLFAPLIYVAWADGDLEDTELASIATHLAQTPGLEAAVSAEIVLWLDPNNPPTAGELAALLERIRSSAPDLEQPRRYTLRELGRDLAERDGHNVSAEEIAALESLEDAIGLAGDERAGSILWPLRPAPVSENSDPTFDVEALAAVLNRPHAKLRADVLDFLGALEWPAEPSRAHYRETIHAWLEQLAERGWGKLAYPKTVGGDGDLTAFLAVFETLGYGDLSLLVKYGVQFGLYGLAISMLGSERHHSEFLPDAGSLATAGCFAMTETGHGSNVADLETIATFDADTDAFVIETPNPMARKDYIGNAANFAELAVVFAQLTVGQHDHGVHAFVVPLRDKEGRILPGRLIEECGPKLGLDGVDNGRISFSQVRVPRGALLDRFAQVTADGNYHSEIASPGRRFFTMLGTLVGGRIAVASASVSAGKLALTIALRYADRRRQFGPAGQPELRLIDYPQHRRRLLPDLAMTFALHGAVRAIGSQFAERGHADQRLEAEAAAIKALASSHASNTIARCREACGGRGYLSESRFAQLKADTEVFTTFEGDNTVLLQLVAKSLISDYARGMRELGVIGIAKHIAKRAMHNFNRDPFVLSRFEPEHLRDVDVQGKLLLARQDDLIHSLAKRLKRRIDDGQSSFAAFTECQPHAISLAKAAAERLAFEAIVGLEAELGDDPPFDLVRSLLALSMIERDRAWFLENHYLEPSKSMAVRTEVDSLCAELAPHSLTLVSAFGLANEVIRAPIGKV